MSTIDTEMQYFVISFTACCAQKNSIYCDEAFQYIGHRNAVFLMPSLDGVLGKTAFVELQPLNTSDTEKQYLCSVFNIYWAQKYSLYCGAMIEYKGHRNAVFL